VSNRENRGALISCDIVCRMM